MQFTNFDKKMFLAARAEAEKSTFAHFNLGCVITYKGHIIGRGRNSDRTHPLQKKYNEKYRGFNPCSANEFRHSLHAEVSALMSIPYTVGRDINWSKANVYVYRICQGKPSGYGCSKPCRACTQALRECGIRNVFFTDDDGLSYIRLD